jgi:hypothetical protein
MQTSAGRLFETPTFEWLDAHEERSTTFYIRSVSVLLFRNSLFLRKAAPRERLDRVFGACSLQPLAAECTSELTLKHDGDAGGSDQLAFVAERGGAEGLRPITLE